MMDQQRPVRNGLRVPCGTTAEPEPKLPRFSVSPGVDATLLGRLPFWLHTFALLAARPKRQAVYHAVASSAS